MAAAFRFVEILREFVDDLLDNSIPEKTKTSTKYGMKIFHGKLCCFFGTRQNKIVKLYFFDISFQYYFSLIE